MQKHLQSKDHFKPLFSDILSFKCNFLVLQRWLHIKGSSVCCTISTLISYLVPQMRSGKNPVHLAVLLSFRADPGWREPLQSVLALVPSVCAAVLHPENGTVLYTEENWFNSATHRLPSAVYHTVNTAVLNNKAHSAASHTTLHDNITKLCTLQLHSIT